MIMVSFYLTGCQAVSEKNTLAALENTIQRIAQEVEKGIVVIELTTTATNPEESDSAKAARRFGSGFAYNQDGCVVTTEGLIGTADSVWVITQKGQRVPATVVGKDFETNIAVLKVDHAGLLALHLLPSAIPNGSLAILVGNTYYSEGLASGLGTVNQTWIGGGDFLDDKLLSIHIDWPGMHSGTPVLDINGHLIGMAEGHLESFEAVWTIIPSTTITTVADKLIRDGRVTRGWLGMRSNPVCPREKTARLMKQWKGKGAVVSSLVTDSPADRAGVLVGDVVTKLNEEYILCISDLRRILTAMKPGAIVVLTVNRDGEEFTVETVLGSVPDDPERQRRCIRRSA